jgi:putative transposase
MKGFVIRLFPTEEQEQKLWQSIGTARWVWNWGVAFNLNHWKETGKILFEYELKKEFTKLRNSGEFPWLKEVAAKVPAMTLLNLGKSYKQCFSKRKKGMEAGLPKFKKKGKAKDTFGLDGETVKFHKDGVQIPMIGHIRFKSEFSLEELQSTKIWSPRITFNRGKWLLSFALEFETSKPQLSSNSVGIDLGIKTLAVASCDGKIYKAKNINRNHKVIRRRKQLKHQQRSLSRKQKGSNNRKKALMKVQKCYAKIADIQRNHVHQVTTKIVNLLPQKIVLEDLNVQGMMKNRHLARAISEQNFFTFREFIKYKAEDRGIEVVLADRFFPSSKTCSSCGHKVEKLLLNQRVYKCPVCGLEIGRDENAARNLETYEKAV